MDDTEKNEGEINMVPTKESIHKKYLAGRKAHMGGLDDVIRSMDDAMIVTDATERVVLMNPAAENLLGMPLDNAHERSIASVIKNTELNEKIKTALEDKTPGYHFIFKLPDDDQEYPRVMRVSTWRIKDEQGKETGFAINFVDISSERDMDLMRRELVSWIAHQVRTPLTSIRGFSEILVTRDDLKEEEKKEYLSHIYEQSVLLSKFIHKILDTPCDECGGKGDIG